MKKISVIIFLCLIAVLIREVIYLGIGSYFGSLLVNLLGSIIFIVVKGSIKLTSKQQSIFNIVFLGSLTTYSGVYKVMFDLIGNEMYLSILIYFIMMFIFIPLITYPIYTKKISGAKI